MNGYDKSMVERETQTPFRARLLALGAVVAGLMLMLSLAAAPAQAEFGIVPGSFKVDVYEADGTTLDTQAGGHPYQAIATMRFNTVDVGNTPIDPDENVKDIEVRLPAGFLGNPEATAKCARDIFDSVVTTFGMCPPASQVGIVELETLIDGQLGPLTVPLYNIEPRAGQVADFGLPVSVVAVHAVASVNTDSDHSLTVKFTNVSQAVPLASARLTFWGVPADTSHDTQRSCFPAGIITGQPCSAGLPRRAFLTNPSTCNGPVTTTARVNSWQNPEVFKTYDSTTAVGPTGCDKQKFDAKIAVQPDNRVAGAPAGYDVVIDVPQNEDPDGIATPPLKRAVVTMPKGVSISPSAADGLQGCTDAQFNRDAKSDPTCPESSKVGTSSLDTPLLGEAMTGDIYIGQPIPGQTFRVFVTLRGPGLLIKLLGNINPDPATGQITATFDDNPPLPFSQLRLNFKGGPRAVLSNPPTCGPATTTAQFTGHGVAGAATPSSSFEVTRDGHGAPCANGFNPSFKAGSVNPAAGAASPFTATFARSDQDQTMGGIAVSMPQGITGIIASADLCGDAQAAAGTCGEASRIGSVTTSSGPGSNPFQLPGRVYITGPYKGAPFGMSIVVPAVAGPYDLGTVVVRASIFVDKTTAALRVVSDPLPTILQGVPLQIRGINVRIDRNGFMLNPTGCSPKTIAGQVASVLGSIADRSSRYQVGGCKSLPYKPKMTVKMGARGRTRAGITAPLDVSLAMTPGQANNRSVSVSLPRNVNARLKVINEKACTFDQFQSGTCPQANRIGTAKAVTPLLKDPLQGDVFFVRNPARRLPDLMVGLKGQVNIDLTGKVTVNRNLTLRTDFDTVPDVPITNFNMKLAAGRNGPVGFVASACTKAARAERATLIFRAHSGRVIRANQRLSIVGCGKATTRKSTRRASGKK